jgi:predicted ATP-dependent protease
VARQKVKADDAPKTGNNPFEDPFTEEVIESYEALDEKCEQIMMEAVRKCKKPREEQRDLLDQAGARGMSKRALKAHLKERALDRKKEAIREKMEPDDQDMLDLLKQHLGVLGDTPLGQHALKAAEAQGSA